MGPQTGPMTRSAFGVNHCRRHADFLDGTSNTMLMSEVKAYTPYIRDCGGLSNINDPSNIPAPGADPFTYFVQAGAFRTPEDAEAQRAKLGMMGIHAQVSEREQNGRTVYRVRVGPFNQKALAELTQEQLSASGIESALVRVQR